MYKSGDEYLPPRSQEEDMMGQTPPTSLGIDVAKAKFDAALLCEGKLAQRTFAMDPEGFATLCSWVHQRGIEQVHACLEATGEYGAALALALYEAGHLVSIVNPTRIAAYAKSRLARTKTDKSDAALIARFCAQEQPPIWTPPSAEVQDLQALVRRVDMLQEMVQQEENRRQSGGSSSAVQASIAATLVFLRQELAKTQRLVQQQVEQSAELRSQQQLLCSIPGVGLWTAARVLAEIEAVRGVVDARQLAAYAGLTPHERTSGSSVHHPPRLVKTGNSRLRRALYFPAMVAMRHNPAVHALAERLRARGKRPMVIVGAAMRKLLHLIYGVLKSGKPFDPAVALAA
jgi:transposase